MSISALLYGGNQAIVSKIEVALMALSVDRATASAIADRLFEKAENHEIDLNRILTGISQKQIQDLTKHPNRRAMRDRLIQSGISPDVAAIIAGIINDDHLEQPAARPIAPGEIRSKMSLVDGGIDRNNWVTDFAKTMDQIQKDIDDNARRRIFMMMSALGYGSDIANNVATRAPAKFIVNEFSQADFVSNIDRMIKTYPDTPISTLIADVSMAKAIPESIAGDMHRASMMTPNEPIHASEIPTDEQLASAIHGTSELKFIDDQRAPSPKMGRM